MVLTCYASKQCNLIHEEDALSLVVTINISDTNMGFMQQNSLVPVLIKKKYYQMKEWA